jgi:hypothetical protein
LFVKEPEVTISLICFDSDFYAPEPRAAHGDSTAMATQTLVPYDGDIETGIRFIMNVNRSLPNFVLHHRAGSTSAPERDMIFNTALSSGDVIEIQTYAGDKHVTLTRGGVTTSILYGLDPASIWTELVPGNNYIRVSSSGAPISYTIEFTERYGGL